MDDTINDEITARLREKARSILVERFAQNCDDARTFGNLGADSLDRVEIDMAMEEAFKIEIADDHWIGLGRKMEIVDIDDITVGRYLDAIMELDTAARLAELNAA